MQWDKVKNILLVILLAVNVFLLANLGLRYYSGMRRAEQLADNVEALLAARNITLTEEFALPDDLVLPLLSIDRSRVDEEAVAEAMLGADATHSEDEDGNVRFESDMGVLVWGGDGSVQGSFRLESGVPEDDAAAAGQAEKLFRAWGVMPEDGRIDVVERIATLSALVAGLPVHNRHLTLYFAEDASVQLTGYWSFGTPYAATNETGIACAAADALLSFVSEKHEITEISGMEAGYRLYTDSDRRLQLVPTWKITTDLDEFLFDCAKNTLV